MQYASRIRPIRRTWMHRDTRRGRSAARWFLLAAFAAPWVAPSAAHAAEPPALFPAVIHLPAAEDYPPPVLPAYPPVAQLPAQAPGELPAYNVPAPPTAVPAFPPFTQLPPGTVSAVPVYPLPVPAPMPTSAVIAAGFATPAQRTSADKLAALETTPPAALAQPPATRLAGQAPNANVSGETGAVDPRQVLPAHVPQMASRGAARTEPLPPTQIAALARRPVPAPQFHATRPYRPSGGVFPPPDAFDFSGYADSEKRLALRQWAHTKELVFRTGAVLPVGGGFWRENTDTSFGVQVSVRSYLNKPWAKFAWFNELGGAYLQNDGANVPVTVSGTFFDGTTPLPDGLLAATPIDNYAEMTLRRLRRFSGFGALGFYFRPDGWNHPGVRDVRIATRIGGRLGHAHADFQQEIDPIVSALAALHVLGGSNPVFFGSSPNLSNSDTYWGMFTSIGWYSTWYNLPVGCRRPSTLGLGAELEFNHEWLEIKGFSADGQHGLSTLTPMLSLTLAW